MDREKKLEVALKWHGYPKPPSIKKEKASINGGLNLGDSGADSLNRTDDLPLTRRLLYP